MKIIREITGQQLEAWGGAVYTLRKISDEDKLDELEQLIEELYPDGIGETELNDLLWFDSDWICETLGIAAEDSD